MSNPAGFKAARSCMMLKAVVYWDFASAEFGVGGCIQEW